MPTSQSNTNPTIVSIENNFTKGLLTEFTGLNFPENAATDTANCIYTLVGDVTRRDGFDFENNQSFTTINRNNCAITTFKWDNAGGDGLTQIVVNQVGGNLYFYRSSSSTTSVPLSGQFLSGQNVNVASFVAAGGTFDPTQECQFATGNGYLFIFNPNCDPFYCTYNNGIIKASAINVQIRDFTGVPENIPANYRPPTLSQEHLYNLTNQGWTSGGAWSAYSSDSVSPPIVGTTAAWNVGSGISGITNGQVVKVVGNIPGNYSYQFNGSATVIAYSGGFLSLNFFQASSNFPFNFAPNAWQFTPSNTGYISTWNTAESNFPSNADVWWYFKNSSGVFDPATTQPNVTLAQANAPQGHYVLSAFNQNRSAISGVANITNIMTGARPTTGTWFQGRVWYTGLNASQQPTGDAQYYTWTENIYFSQIVQNNPAQFGYCYQANDPTSEQLFDLLPTDGGVITIPGSGPIYKLFPLLNAMLVFAANGVWYISGGTSIGFTATDYSIVQLSHVKSLSASSFVDINGLPMFWNEEGIYQVEPAKQGTGLLNSPLHVQPLEVNPVTVGTILSYYNNIPLQSKKYAKAAYNPIDYVVQWCFKSTNETSTTDRYTYDSILNFNTFNKAFYPYTFSINVSTNPSINGIIYVSSPGGTGAPNSIFKYIVSTPNAGSYLFTFGEENSTTFLDWATSGAMVNYTSYFVTGFKVHGQAQRRFQMPYVYMYSRGPGLTGYTLQGVWDFAGSPLSGRWSTIQFTNINNPNYGMNYRRHRIRGRGIALQMKVSSIQGQDFDIMGWSAYETQNVSV